ncbi:MAG TPA: SprT family zinc-dependent metalloprotease [Steroidobacteraceae bacterium]|nr:SprT family zinc-dependent metalloprotease [Steroidobacteraceae bacterium]
MNQVIGKTSPQLSLFSTEEDPRAWNVRISKRARRLSVRVYPAGRVEVVVPRSTTAWKVQQFVSRHREWIEERVRESSANQITSHPPQEILLPAIERQVQVDGIPSLQSVRVRKMNERHIQLHGALDAPAQWSRVLNRWLVSVAEQEFSVRLQQLAVAYGFNYERVQIRRQRTRWGSCSSRGTISLNVCALFLRPEVLRYLMIHELSHTKQMNHSRKFWKLVASCEPNYRELDRELTAAWRHVPPWVFAG